MIATGRGRATARVRADDIDVIDVIEIIDVIDDIIIDVIDDIDVSMRGL